MTRSIFALTVSLLMTPLLCDVPAARAEETPDVLKGVIDPFDPGDERRRFLAAAGVDGELDEQEFKANQSASEPFVRKFDSWHLLKAFDRNRNNSLDWFEVEGYRQAVRDAVLKAYDKNQDNRLTDAEREAAAREVAGGRLPRPALPDQGGAVLRGNNNEWDTNGDGKMDEQERAAYNKAQQERQARWHADYVKKWDADGDGKVSFAEAETARKAQWEEWKAKNPEEAARYEERQAAFKKQQEEYLRKWDADGDGQLSPEEHKAASDDRIREWREKNPEQAALWDKQQEEYKRRQEEYLRKWDTDGDGKLSPEEHRIASETIMREWRQNNPEAAARWDRQQEEYRKQQEERIRKYDADGDGKLSPQEWQEVWKNERPQGGFYPGSGGGIIRPFGQ